MAPLLDNNDYNNPSNNNDNGNPFLTSKDSSKGPPAVTNHFSTDKRTTEVTIDATIANQLLKELLVDSLTYVDYDHIPLSRKHNLIL